LQESTPKCWPQLQKQHGFGYHWIVIDTLDQIAKATVAIKIVRIRQKKKSPATRTVQGNTWTPPLRGMKLKTEASDKV